jgi:hypothetical protein
VTGGGAKDLMSASGLPTASLRKIWELSDVDKDGKLDLEEFVVCMVLLDLAKRGGAVPAALDEGMVPPSMRA